MEAKITKKTQWHMVITCTTKLQDYKSPTDTENL